MAGCPVDESMVATRYKNPAASVCTLRQLPTPAFAGGVPSGMWWN
jgi:hypothetical protein